MGNRFPGPVSRFRLTEQLDDGTLCRQVSAVSGPTGVSLWPDLQIPGFLDAVLGNPGVITAADKAEFEVIKRMPVYSSKRRPYHTVGHYVSDRTLYFGLPSVYETFALESDAELVGTKWVRNKRTRTLRSMIEFSNDVRKQKIFYRWVRKAYVRKYGDEVNVPELIRKGMSQELAEKIKDVRGSIRVKKIHDEDFHAGGFNPRPIKFGHRYLLGTLSEHATGMAVDIDDQQNAQLTIDEWNFIEALAGKKIVRSGRWDTEQNAEGLWKEIHEINILFVKKVANEVQALDRKRAEKQKSEELKKVSKYPATQMKTSPRKPHNSLQEVLGGYYGSLSTWATKGFFQLPLDLVLELHAHGFTWGATFRTNVDLHHFELD